MNGRMHRVQTLPQQPYMAIIVFYYSCGLFYSIYIYLFIIFFKYINDIYIYGYMYTCI
jgi:hypothetical protein